MSTDALARLKGLLHEDPAQFPVGEGITALGGRTLYKGGNWFKAILLVETHYGSTAKQQVRFYGWQKNDNGEWKQRQKFNISPANYVQDVISVLSRFAGTSPQHVIDVEQELTETMRNLRDELEDLEEQNYQEADEKRRDQLPKLKDQVTEFQGLLQDESREKDVQKFLRENSWFFGPQYYSVEHEPQAGMRGRNDFLLKKRGGFHDIVELKKPSHDLFLDSTRWKMSSKLRDALSQMARYLDYYNKHYLSHKDQTGQDVYNPKGIIVIGRDQEANIQEELKKHERLFSRNIEIRSYDDLVDRANRTITTYEEDAS